MIRNLALLLIATLFLPLSAYAISPEEAQEWLKGKNVPYTADEFVSRAAQGDFAVVDLFLGAGMDPDVKDKDGRTAMQVAIEQARGDIIEDLIEKGADPSPLISTLGDRDSILQNIKSLGYITDSGEYSSGEESVMKAKGKELSDTTVEVLRFMERMRTADSMTLLSPSVYNEIKVEQEGFGGLGIVISLDKDKVLSVMEPIEDTPASRAGVEAGDKITEINGESTEGIVLEEAVKKLRGLKGSHVKITVKRLGDGNDEEETLRFTLVRDRIKIPSVKQEMLDSDIGCIHISEFRRDTVDDFRESIRKLRSEGMRHLVLDLRNNPGGSLQVAMDIADKFIEKDRLICALFSTHADLNTELKATQEKSLHFEIPVVILVNGGTTGASEVVAAALRDAKLAIMLGEKTSGMGSLTNIIPLSDGSALKLTTAGLLTSNREPVDEVGLTPDIAVKGNIYASVRDFSLGFSEKNQEESAEGKPGDTQLRWALEFLKSYDLSKTLEQNISSIEEGIGSGSDKGKNERILWDKLERQNEGIIIMPRNHDFDVLPFKALPEDNEGLFDMYKGIQDNEEELQEQEKNDSNE